MLDPTRSQEERELIHREMVERSPSPIFLLDASTAQVLEANPAAARLLGYEGRDLIGVEFQSVLGGEPGDVERLIRHVALHRHDIFGETELVRRDGSLMPVEISGDLLIVGDREVVCLFARDVSERKAALAERFRLEKQLWH
jgi:PAS domain S-box-containing protein